MAKQAASAKPEEKSSQPGKNEPEDENMANTIGYCFASCLFCFFL
jgi:hypothetical protein